MESLTIIVNYTNPYSLLNPLFIRGVLKQLRLSLPPALQYPAYRAYWLGMLASVSGYQMFRVAQVWLVYEITGSPLYLGYAAAANALPGIFFNLVGGVIADKVDKRRLVMTTQAAWQMHGGTIPATRPINTVNDARSTNWLSEPKKSGKTA